MWFLPPVTGHWLRLSVLQDLATEVQDFFATVLKASLTAKQIFADYIASSGFSQRNADVAKWQTTADHQRTIPSE